MRGRRCEAQEQLLSGQRCVVTAGSQRRLLLLLRRVLHHKGAAAAVHHAAARVVLVQHLSHGLVNGSLCMTQRSTAHALLTAHECAQTSKQRPNSTR